MNAAWLTKGRTYHGTRRRLSLGKDAWIHPSSRFYAPTCLEDHARVNGPMTVSKGDDEVRIGRFAAIGQDTLFIVRLHETGYPNMQHALQRHLGGAPRYRSKGPIVVGPATWIGDRTVFLSGVSVGAGAVVGTGAVVTSDVPPFAIAAGVPARVVRFRFPKDVVEWLLELAWWDWDMAKIERNVPFFDTDLTRIPLAEAMALIRD